MSTGVVPACSRIAVAAALWLLWSLPAAAQQPSWEEVGPHTVGGRISALAVNPRDPLHAVAGTPAGGLWVTRDGGASWSGLTLWLATVPISAIAFDPVNPDRLLVGTGALADNGAVSGGIGVLTSGDGGGTWTLRTIAAPGAYVSTIVVWPGEPERVLVGTDLGIRLSIDGGATYAPVIDGHAISAIVVDPFDASVAFAATRGGLLRSADRGATWSILSPWPLEPTDEYGAGTSTLALSTRTPGLLFATVQVLGTFNSTARPLLLRSSDGGHTFANLAAPEGLCPGPATCGFAQALALDPESDSRLLVGGERLFLTPDGGGSWQELEGNLAGVHRLVVQGDSTFAAGRFGVASLNSGWTLATRRNHGLAVTAITSLDATAGPEPRLLAGTEDSGTVLGIGDSPVWRTLFAPGERVGPARFDPFDPLRIVVSRTGGRLFLSSDGGDSFAPAQEGLDFDQPAADLAPVAPSPIEPGVWFTGRLQTFSSRDGAASWGAFRPGGFPEVSLISVSPVVAARVYFATGSGGHLYKADGDTTEQLVVSTEPSLRLTSLFLDPQAQNVMYAAGINTAQQTGRVFKSADFGFTWTGITPPGLAPATSIVKDSFGALYLGTRDGVWRSGNDGYSWARYTQGLFAGGVNALKLSGGWLYAGTTGRGVFRIRELPLVSLESFPPGLRFLVDGNEVTGPFLAHWPAGSVHTITPVLRNTVDTREEFLGWSDGAPETRTITATDASSWFIAAVRRSFRLASTAAPAAGGTVTFAPASADGFYPERSMVTVIPVPAPDHRISGFGGQHSGDDGLVAFAFMDQPRTVEARFEPLRFTLESQPSGIPLLFDGATVSTPATYDGVAGATHTVSAPEFVGDSLYEPVLAFDSWSDLRPRTHTIKITRDTFVTDLKARYISTVRGVEVPAGGARRIVTRGEGHAARMAGLTLTPVDAGVPDGLQFVRGSVGGHVTTELALVPSSARVLTSVVATQDADGAAGRLRIAAFNPSAVEAWVGILLRDASGAAQAAMADALIIAPGAHATAWLDEVMALPPSFTSLITLIASQPIVVSVQSWRGNERPSYLRDPIMVAPFSHGDYGVPLDARVQVALLTPDTTHSLVIANTGFSALAGTVEFLDANGAPLTLSLADGAATGAAYDLAPGAFVTLTFPTPGGAAGAMLPTLQVLVRPGQGQPSPAIQLLEERIVGEVNGSPTRLPRAIPPSSAATSFRIPMSPASRETGLVFTNTSPFAITLRARVLDLEGVERQSSVETVPPGSQTILSSEAFAGTVVPDFRGLIAVTADIPVHAVGYLRFFNARGEEIVAGFPALTDQPAIATSSLAIDGDSWRSEWWFFNRSAGTARSLLDFRGRLGSAVYFPE